MDTQKSLAIVSGGGGYIGGAISSELRGHGWEVAALSRHAAPGVYTCDATDEKAVQATIAAIVKAHGPIGACIHAAALPLERVGLLATATESFDAHMNTAARAAFLLAKACVPNMAQGAAFIGITSQAIEAGVVQPSGAYVPAKYALRGLLRVLASEVKEKGIRVYAVTPGFLPGGLNSDIPEPVRNFIASKSGTDAHSTKALSELVRKLCTNEMEAPSGSSVAFPSLEISLL